MQKNRTNVDSLKKRPVNKNEKIKLCSGIMKTDGKEVEIPPKYSAVMKGIKEEEEFITIQAYNNTKRKEEKGR